MTKVRMLTTSAGPQGVIRPGEVIEVSESEARLLVKFRYAETLDGNPVPDLTEKPVVIPPAQKPTAKKPATKKPTK